MEIAPEPTAVATIPFSKRPDAGGAAKPYFDLFDNQDMRIFALLAQGGSMKEVAEMIGVEERSAWYHINKTYQKMGVRNLYQFLTEIYGKPDATTLEPFRHLLTEKQQQVCMAMLEGMSHKEAQGRLGLGEKSSVPVSSIFNALNVSSAGEMFYLIYACKEKLERRKGFFDRFTTTQARIFEYMVQGYTPTETSELTGILLKTVSAGITGIYKEMGVETSSKFLAKIYGEPDEKTLEPFRHLLTEKQRKICMEMLKGLSHREAQNSLGLPESGGPLVTRILKALGVSSAGEMFYRVHTGPYPLPPPSYPFNRFNRFSNFNDQDMQIFSYLAEGRAQKEIADVDGVGGDIIYQARKFFRKMGVSNLQGFRKKVYGEPPDDILAPFHDVLSVREREVAMEVLRGLPEKKICRKFNIAHGTLSVHMTNIRGKMGVQSKGELFYAVYSAKYEAAPAPDPT